MSLINYIQKPNKDGSITVFLSLILLLILSLILTITEGARVSSGKVYAERALSTAMDSVLAQYYGPLWEEYHIFGYYPGEGSNSEQAEQIAAKLSDYMSYTFEPDKNLNNKGERRWELYDINLDSALADNTTMLMDYQGKLLMNEAVEYMKYREIGNGAELLLDKLSLLEEPQKVSYVYEEKQKAEEELVEIDKGILELMELLDGLKTSKKGIEVTGTGALKTVDYFVKQICLGEVTKEAVEVNQDSVFEALKGSYQNPITELDAMRADFTSLRQISTQIDIISAEITSLSNGLSTVWSRLEQLSSSMDGAQNNSQSIQAAYHAINAMQQAISACYAELGSLEEAKRSCISGIYNAKKRLSQLISGIKPKISKAITRMDDIIYKAGKAAPLIKEYENILNSSHGIISEDTFKGLSEDLEEMKKYSSVDTGGYNLSSMKEILKKDFIVLTQTESLLNQGENELMHNNYETAEYEFMSAADQISKYRIHGLTLDYSTLVFDRSAKESPLSAMNELLQSGILSMVIDPDKISDQELSLSTLPSEIAVLSGEKADYLSKLKEFFKTAAKGDSSPGTGELFGCFGEDTDFLSMAGEGINKISEQLLYQEYLKEQFGLYVNNRDSSLSKPSALIYEQEYLLSGHQKDRDNLSGTIYRILFLRTILDFVSILGDSAKRNEARAAATALVGFTGLPILIGITQVLILLAWSFAEALLDVCALLKGLEVPILKKNIILGFPDLFMLNRQFLESKADVYKNPKELSMPYQDYLRIFLLLKDKKELAYRSMDLMQENIKIRYNVSNFDMTKCLYGYEAAVNYTIPSKFTGISFVQKYLNTSNKGYKFTAEAACSY